MKSFLIRKKYSLKIRIFNSLHKKSPKIALISSEKWREKVLDDLLIASELNKKGYRSEIISWEKSQNRADSYAGFLITSMWGYEDSEKSLEKWLEFFSNKKIENKISIIKNNYDKKLQQNLLEFSGIPTIPTIFIEKNPKNLKISLKNAMESLGVSLAVVKPTVSGSGKNTFLIGNSDRKHSFSIDSLPEKLYKVSEKKSLMVQPFLEEIDNGELAVVMLNGEISHAVMRYPHIFNDSGEIHAVDVSTLDSSIKNLCEKITKINEYKNALYSRIDLVKKDGKYLVMEVEFFEPQLYFYLQKNKISLLDSFVSAFLDKIS